MERVYDELGKETKENRSYIFIKTEYRLERVSFCDIYFVEGMGDYRNVHTSSKKILTLQTFSELEKELPASQFCRVHKSYIVSMDKINSIERNRIKIKETLIPISDNYREKFYNLVGIRND